MSTQVTTLVPLSEQPLELRLAANIRAEMARNQLTQADVARTIGVSTGAVSFKLRGIRPISMNEFELIAALLRLTPAQLMSGAGVRHLEGELPRLDSNQQPADYLSPQVSGMDGALDHELDPRAARAVFELIDGGMSAGDERARDTPRALHLVCESTDSEAGR